MSPRLRHTDDRMDQQVAANLFSGSVGQLFVRPVHRVARLKGDNLVPVAFFKVSPRFLRRAAEFLEVVVLRELYAL